MSKKIMIIDDEKDFLEMIKLNIECDNRYEVVILSDAENIVDRVKKEKPDAILIDYIMPGVTGVDICRILKKDTTTEKIPVVFISALAKESEMRKAHEAGARGYLIKPVDVDEVMNLLNQLFPS